jgi:hypothetical protein
MCLLGINKWLIEKRSFKNTPNNIWRWTLQIYSKCQKYHHFYVCSITTQCYYYYYYIQFWKELTHFLVFADSYRFNQHHKRFYIILRFCTNSLLRVVCQLSSVDISASTILLTSHLKSSRIKPIKSTNIFVTTME